MWTSAILSCPLSYMYWVILTHMCHMCHTDSYWVISYWVISYWIIWVVSYWLILSHMSHTESYWVILSHMSHTESYESYWVILSHTEPYWVILSHTHIGMFISSVMQVELTRLNALPVKWVCSPYWATPPPPWKSPVSSAKRRRRISPLRSGHSSRLSMCNNLVCWGSVHPAIQVQVCSIKNTA